MDLTDILLERTRSDLRVAHARTLELSLEIQRAAAELAELRSELARLENDRQKAAPVAGTRPRSSAGSAPPANSGTQSRRSTWLERTRRKLRSRFSTPARLQWHLDEIAGQPVMRNADGAQATISASGSQMLTFSGWIVPLDTTTPFARAVVALKGSSANVVREVAIHERPDVGAHLDRVEFAASGFRVAIPTYEMPEGRYMLNLSGKWSDGTEASLAAGIVTIVD